MGCSSGNSEEENILEFLNKKKDIISNHISNNTKLNSDEIQLVSKMDIEILEFITKKIDIYNNLAKTTDDKDIIKKLDYYNGMQKEFDKLNVQWEGLLGYKEKLLKYEKEEKEFVRQRLANDKPRKSIFAGEEEVEVEEEIKSKDYYCNSPFFEGNPKKVGENKDIFDSMINSEVDEDENLKQKYPYVF